MSAVTETHEEKETLAVDVELPGHDPRKTTSLFEHSKKELEARVGGRCYICGRTSAEAGPLQAHHHPIERCFANMIDWERVALDFPTFDWKKFFAGAKRETYTVPAEGDVPAFTATVLVPVDPYLFVDDMRYNGLLLCADHHIHKDEGIHDLPFPIWIAQRYGKEGYKFSDVEIIHHEQEPSK